MTDIIFIRGLRISTVIGLFDWEQSIKQSLVFDLEITAQPNSDGMIIDYAAVSTRLIDFVGNQKFILVEHVAEKVTEILFTEFHATWFRLSIAKIGAVPAAKEVGVCIERGVR